MSSPSTGVMAARKAIDILGGVVQAARKLKVKNGRHQTVQAWLRTRVPAEYCPTIERETAGQVRCEQLRPDIEWEVLRNSALPLIDVTRQPAAQAAHQESRDAA